MEAEENQEAVGRSPIQKTCTRSMFFPKKRSILKILVFLKFTEGLALTGGLDSILCYEYGFEVIGIGFSLST